MLLPQSITIQELFGGLRMQWDAPASQVERLNPLAGRPWGPPHPPRTPPFESVPAMAAMAILSRVHGFFVMGIQAATTTLSVIFSWVGWFPMIVRLLPPSSARPSTWKKESGTELTELKHPQNTSTAFQLPRGNCTRGKPKSAANIHRIQMDPG